MICSSGMTRAEVNTASGRRFWITFMLKLSISNGADKVERMERISGRLTPSNIEYIKPRSFGFVQYREVQCGSAEHVLQ